MGADGSMSATLDHIPPVELSERLRIAREAAKITQAAAAAAARMARTTLVAIEQGQRKARIDELQVLAKLYGTSVNALLRREAVHVDLVPKYRKLTEQTDPAVEAAGRLLTDLVKAEVELENLLGIHRVRNYPQQRPILPGDVYLQAEQDALEVRHWLGLGLAPISDMNGLLELQLGVRVFVRKLPTRISGLYAFDDTVGACVLMNAVGRRSRRQYTAAHELGHLVSSRGDPDILLDGSQEKAREERYANAFARGFLLPARAVMQQFQELTVGASHLSRRHVILLAHVFGVSREAMVRRLEELKLAKPGTWDWFQSHGGITDVQERQVLGDSALIDTDRGDANGSAPIRLNQMAAEAWQKDLLSEGQLARLMHLDRVALRELLDALADDPSEADGVLELRG
jgi:Zn-dependent peptidase ImmA (M78 family)/transcriptional regulator with XRE-family HTH domain